MFFSSLLHVFVCCFCRFFVVIVITIKKVATVVAVVVVSGGFYRVASPMGLHRYYPFAAETGHSRANWWEYPFYFFNGVQISTHAHIN